MDRRTLEEIGLTVRESDTGLEAELELLAGSVLNPLTRQFIQKVAFAVVGDRLVALAPPEVLGLPPLALGGIERASEIEAQLGELFNEHVTYLQRRSAELQALGLPAKVDPATLELTTELTIGPFEVRLAADKRGNFRIAHVDQDGKAVPVENARLELSEFRERSALEGYLWALLEGGKTQPAAAAVAPLRIREVLEQFGAGIRLPPKSALEILAEAEVNGQRYRFAAARIANRTFRGLLAGRKGKIWAGRFELEEFPGVAALLAETLGVPIESVRLEGEPEEAAGELGEA